MQSEIFKQRRILVLRSGRERVVANRHPWIFGGAIAGESGPADTAFADLVDGRGVRLASGFYSPHSQIRLRALTFEEEEVTADLLESRIAAAIARRHLDSETNAARVINAEGDDLSGLVVDRYDDVLVIEIANFGVEQVAPLIAEVLQRQLTPRLMYFKNDLPARRLEQLTEESRSIGEGAPATTIRENGLQFEVDPVAGQKTGFFLDQRENRALARRSASGRRVLNLFSYTGAFGVYAGAGGAMSVENVDSSAPAVEGARRNHARNGIDATFHVADAFQFVRQTPSRFDLVICDPPAFARSRADIDRAARGYKDINLFAMKLIEPGGLMMTFSCSGHMSIDLFQKVIFAAAQDAGRRVSFVKRLTAADDHPVSIYCPEGEYLKGFLLQVLG
jgi:23S rRNA (cytosine1962-C5)-methyltransferase